MGKIKHIQMPDYHVKISKKPDHHALQNLSTDTDVNFNFSENNINPPREIKPFSTLKYGRDVLRSSFQRMFGRVQPKWFPSLKGQEFFSLILTGEIFNKKSGSVGSVKAFYFLLKISPVKINEKNSCPLRDGNHFGLTRPNLR